METKETEVKREKKKKKKFEQSDGILCHSVTQGALYMEGKKTGILYDFTDYGDEAEIEYRDLVAEVRSRSSFIFNPYFIVDDEDFIAEFPQLSKFYKEQYTVSDLRGVLELPIDEMLSEISTLPNGAKESLKSIAATEISEGRLDSVKKIKTLDELFGTNLDLLSNLFNR